MTFFFCMWELFFSSCLLLKLDLLLRKYSKHGFKNRKTYAMGFTHAHQKKV